MYSRERIFVELSKKYEFMKNDIRRMYTSAFLCNFWLRASLHPSLFLSFSFSPGPFVRWCNNFSPWHSRLRAIPREFNLLSFLVPGRVVIDYSLKHSVIPSSRYSDITRYAKCGRSCSETWAMGYFDILMYLYNSHIFLIVKWTITVLRLRNDNYWEL